MQIKVTWHALLLKKEEREEEEEARTWSDEPLGCECLWLSSGYLFLGGFLGGRLFRVGGELVIF